jgi:hypothetical protein
MVTTKINGREIDHGEKIYFNSETELKKNR